MSEGMRPSARDILGSMRAESQAAYGGGSDGRGRRIEVHPMSPDKGEAAAPLRDRIGETFRNVREGKVGGFAAGLINASKDTMKSPTFWYGVLTAGTVAGVRSIAMHSGGAEASEFFALAVGGALGAAKEGVMERVKGGDKRKIARAVLTGALVGAVSADIGYRSAGSAGWGEAGAEIAKLTAVGSLAAFSSFARRAVTEGRAAFSGKTLKEMAVSGVMAGAFAGAADWLLGTGVEKTGETGVAPSSPEGSGVRPTRDPWDYPDVRIEGTPIHGRDPRFITPVVPPEGVGPDASLTPTPTVTPETVVAPATPTPTPEVAAVATVTNTAEPTIRPSVTPTSEPATSTPFPTNTSTATPAAAETQILSTATKTPEPPTSTATTTPTAVPPTSTTVPAATATVMTAEPTPTPESAARGARSAWESIRDWFTGGKPEETVQSPVVPTPVSAPSPGAAQPVPGQPEAGQAIGPAVPPESAEQAAIREAAERAAKAKNAILNPAIIPSELIQSGEINPDIQTIIQNEVNSAPAGFLSTEERVTLENLTYPYMEMADTTEPLTLNQPDEYYARVENNPDISSLKGLTEGRIGELVLRDPDFQVQRDSLIDELIKDPKTEEGVKNALIRIKEGREDISIDSKEFTVGNGAHQAIFDKFREANPDKYKQLFDVGYLVTKTASSGSSFLPDKPDLFRHGEQLLVPKMELLKKVYKL